MGGYEDNYIIDEKGRITPCSDLEKWGEFMKKDRTVARNYFWRNEEIITVSTVFLGMNHSYEADAPPGIV